MATTISFPTAVTTNVVNANRWFADNGLVNSSPSNWITEADITLSSFSSLSIPAGATINGIEVIVEGIGNPGPGVPSLKAYNGSSYSSNEVFLSNLPKSPYTVFDPGWGGSSDLWGLSWNATTAAAIQIQLDCSTIPSGRKIFFDYIKVRITYTAAAGYGNAVNGVAAANIGKVNGVATADIDKVNGA